MYDFSKKGGNFEYLTKASAVYSSNIEGNSIDLNSYMNYELNADTTHKGKEIQEIQNLITAYEWAQTMPLDENNFKKSHSILSETLLIKSKRGNYRSESVGVFDRSGLVYMAVESEYVEREMRIFFADVELLLERDLSEIEVLYFASLMHLRFVHIHPFMDGNGRSGRLLEKWFVAQKLGKKFWEIPSEEYYKNHQKEYYTALNLGVNFYELDYSKSLDFLKMLAHCMR